jgi:hypothetical protein
MKKKDPREDSNGDERYSKHEARTREEKVWRKKEAQGQRS